MKSRLGPTLLCALLCAAALLTTCASLPDPVTARADPSSSGDSGAIARHVLDLVNAARAHPRRCGRSLLGAAPPLTLSRTLTDVASSHARDMAQHGSMDHRGSDGS